VFGEGANFKRARVDKMAYFGSARFRKDTTFTGLYAEREVYFNSARFEGPVRFDTCEWQRAATFEDARFDGPVTFSATRVGGRLNLSRAVFGDSLDMKEVAFGGMDLIGAHLLGDARFVDARFDGKVRFSLDDVTRARHLADPTPLLPLYRDYQGDEDADQPLATGTSYGVEHVDDLIARIDGNLSFANSVFGGFVIFERVSFGLPGQDTTAEFYNTQFGGETHFERTTWHSAADFTTIHAEELALNEATFHRTLVLDDANVPGRVTLTDAAFTGDATLSFYGAQIGTFQIDRAQVENDGGHRLFYETCAAGAGLDDLRLLRSFRGTVPDLDVVRRTCLGRAIDEFVSLKQSFGDRAMTADEDWAYWWIKHHETTMGARHGGLAGLAAWPVRFFLFEAAFGWGVRLGNLASTALLVCVLFAIAYKVFCADTVMSYNGDDVKIRDIPWYGVFYISLQSLGGFNTGWDFGESDPRFRYLNTLHAYMGVIILTFFVGAYTRMILA
ncbi:MAG: pentapeptide repeat-containing protein, partial [Myxococcota bacterium]